MAPNSWMLNISTMALIHHHFQPQQYHFVLASSYFIWKVEVAWPMGSHFVEWWGALLRRWVRRTSPHFVACHFMLGHTIRLTLSKTSSFLFLSAAAGCWIAVTIEKLIFLLNRWRIYYIVKGTTSQCLKIKIKVSFNITSGASYVYIEWTKVKMAKMVHFKNMKLAVKLCYQTGQF